MEHWSARPTSAVVGTRVYREESRGYRAVTTGAAVTPDKVGNTYLSEVTPDKVGNAFLSEVTSDRVTHCLYVVYYQVK